MFKRIISSIGDATRTVGGWIGSATARIRDAVYAIGSSIAGAWERARGGRGGVLDGPGPGTGWGPDVKEVLPDNVELVDADALPQDYRAIFFSLAEALEYCSEIPVRVIIWRVWVGDVVVYAVQVLGSDGDV